MVPGGVPSGAPVVARASDAAPGAWDAVPAAPRPNQVPASTCSGRYTICWSNACAICSESCSSRSPRAASSSAASRYRATEPYPGRSSRPGSNAAIANVSCSGANGSSAPAPSPPTPTPPTPAAVPFPAPATSDRGRDAPPTPAAVPFPAPATSDPAAPSSTAANASSKKRRGNGNSHPANTPSRIASACCSHRAIPRLCTTITSGAVDDPSGLFNASASAPTSSSVRLLRAT